MTLFGLNLSSPLSAIVGIGLSLATGSVMSSMAGEKEGEDVLFTSLRAGHLQIFKTDGSGFSETLLTAGSSSDLQPAWSSNGRIAFVSYRSGGGDIYDMNADGSDLRRLTSSPRLEHQPRWSPDGKHLAYTADQGGPSNVLILDTESGQTKVVNSAFREASSPAWSPDGNQLAFVAMVDAKLRIIVADLATGKEHVLTRPQVPANERNPVWAPQGGKILFDWHGKSNEGVHVAMADTQTGETTRLTSNMYINSSGAWSPDGRFIVYLSNADSQGSVMNVMRMKSDGTEVVNLTKSLFAEMSPTWSADGKRIYFMSYRDWPGQIYRMNHDGSNPVRLTTGTSQNSFPVPRQASKGYLQANARPTNE